MRFQLILACVLAAIALGHANHFRNPMQKFYIRNRDFWPKHFNFARKQFRPVAKKVIESDITSKNESIPETSTIVEPTPAEVTTQPETTTPLPTTTTTETTLPFLVITDSPIEVQPQPQQPEYQQPNPWSWQSRRRRRRSRRYGGWDSSKRDMRKNFEEAEPEMDFVDMESEDY